MDHCAFGLVHELGPVIGAIGKEVLDEGPALADRMQDELGPCTVGDVGRRQIDHEQAPVGIDGDGVKHPLGVLEGASENAAVAQALLDNLIERGLDPKVCRLFIIDGAKALRKAIRKTFGKHTPVQRCQIHKGRNILERLPKHLHASVRQTLRELPPISLDTDLSDRRQIW